ATAGPATRASATAANKRPSLDKTALVSSHATETDSFFILHPCYTRGAYAGGRTAAQSSLPACPPHAISPSQMDIQAGIEWRVSDGPVSYEEALAFMEGRAAAIREGSASECVWLLEHPPLFT